MSKRVLAIVCLTIGLVVGLLMGQSRGVSADDDEAPVVMFGSVKAEDLLKMPEEQGEAYLIGLCDGYMVGPLIRDREKLNRIFELIKDKSSAQLHAIAVKHVRQNPEKWNEGANYQVLEAIGFFPSKEQPAPKP